MGRDDRSNGYSREVRERPAIEAHAPERVVTAALLTEAPMSK